MQSNAIMRYIARKHNMCKYLMFIPHRIFISSKHQWLCYVLESPNKSDLFTGGETEDEKVRVDIMENQAMDFRNGFVRLCYTDFVSTTFRVLITLNLFYSLASALMPTSPLRHQDKMKPGYLEALTGTLKQFSGFLGDRKWFAGDKVHQPVNMEDITQIFHWPHGVRTPQQAENHIRIDIS